jgi:putative ATP-binding cassette transporter
VELFKPSINWGHALADSVSWVALVRLSTALSVIAVLALLRVITPWGHQFWRITGDYFTGRHSIRVWLALGVLLLSDVVAVRLNVLHSYQTNDLNSSIQTAVQGTVTGNQIVKQSGIHGFWMSQVILILINCCAMSYRTPFWSASVIRHHDQRLRLLGQGQWQLGRIEGTVPVSVTFH